MLSDFRSAGRSLLRRPLFAGLIVVTVAVGIGASTAIFTVVNAVLFRDLPYSDGDRIYVIRAIGPDGLPGNVSLREFAPIYERKDHPTVEAATIVSSQATQIVGTDQTPHAMVRYGVSYQFFDVFDTRMTLGRGFDHEDLPGRIVMSYPVWRDLFGADPGIIGKTVSAEGATLEVVGVAAADFEFPHNPGFWSLMDIDASRNNERVYRGFVRLRPDRSAEHMQNDVRRLAGELGADPVTGRQPVLVVEPFLDYVVGNLKSTLLVLFGATGILLLVVCINTTHLILSRATAATRKVALREPVRAERYRVVRQLLAETLLLVAIGSVLGFALAAASVGALLSILPEGHPRLGALPIDRAVLLFAVTAGLVATVLVGFIPAWRLARNDLRNLISESGRETIERPERQHLFSALVVTQVALAVVLAIGAVLLVRSYMNLTTTDPGFNPDGALTLTMNVSPQMALGGASVDAPGTPSLASSPYSALAVFLRELEERVANINGIESVGLMTSLPLARHPHDTIMTFSVAGQSGDDDQKLETSPVRSVSPGYFGTMQMRVLRGRGLERSDREGAPGVTVVNESFVRRYLPDLEPLGQRITIHDNAYVPTGSGFEFGHFLVEDLQVVGVVSDVKYASLAQPPEPAIYVSSDQFIDRRRALVVRTSDPPESLVPAIRTELAALDPQLGVQFAAYPTLVQASLARERMAMTLLSIFAGVTLLLASVGVHNFVTYSAELRTGEMAIRSALFVAARQVPKFVMRMPSRVPPVRYALITPARDEQDFIELTLKSVIAQTQLPERWIIVSDGSTDRTDDIVKRYAADHDWIDLVRIPERGERHFGRKVACIQVGIQRLEKVSYDVVGNLDADLSFDGDLFEFLMAKFAANPKLGVAGAPFDEGRGTYDFRFSSVEHVSGACQLFRKECFEAIGGYVPLKGGGIDVVAVLSARMRGWETRTFPEKSLVHHRPMGTALYGGFAVRFKLGQKDYRLGRHFLWQTFRCAYQMTRPPYVIGGVVLWSGFIWSALTRAERPVSRELIEFQRRDQMERLKKKLFPSRFVK